MTKLLGWLKANWIVAAAYVAYIILFWFVGHNHLKITVTTAYFGVVILHLFFFLLVWKVKQKAKRP